MLERLTILRLGHRGDGVADTPQGPAFVPYTLPGETVEAERLPGHSDRRHLLRVEAASPERIAPICPHFGICGGCAVQHWAEPPYRAWKRELVVQALAQMRIDAPVGELIDAHGEGRRRAVLHARYGPSGIIAVGFSGLRAHNIVAIDRAQCWRRPMAVAIPDSLGDPEALKLHRQAARHSNHDDRCRARCRCAGSGPLDSAQTGVLALSLKAGGWRASRAMASL